MAHPGYLNMSGIKKKTTQVGLVHRLPLWLWSRGLHPGLGQLGLPNCPWDSAILRVLGG